MSPLKTLETRQSSDGILTVVLSRPDKLNALNATLLHELSELLDQVREDSDIRGLIITGAGPKAFCAGADIQELSEQNATRGLHFARLGQAVFRKLETLGKVSIAAVQGYAFGGGCELAMSTTLRIASDRAQFGQPEVKLGVIPGYGGTQRLARLVGKGRALELCLTARFLPAEEALAWGLVNRCVPQEALIPAAESMMREILSHGPRAIQSVMEVIDQGYNLSLTEALELEAIHFAYTCATQDKHEGTRAFLEKRPPSFIGE